MVLAIKDNDRYYFFTNQSLSDCRYQEGQFLDPEINPIFKLKYYDKLIGMGYDNMCGSILRAYPGLFKGPLTHEDVFMNACNLYDKCKEYYQVEEKEEMILSPLLVAKDDKCYLVAKDLHILDVDDYFVCGKGGVNDGLISALMTKYKNLPTIERARAVFSDYQKPLFLNPFPIYYMDSKDFKMKTIKS